MAGFALPKDAEDALAVIANACSVGEAEGRQRSRRPRTESRGQRDRPPISPTRYAGEDVWPVRLGNRLQTRKLAQQLGQPQANSQVAAIVSTSRGSRSRSAR
jgi:hypothetical protein